MKLIARGAYDAEGRRKYLSKAEGLKFLHLTASLPLPEAVFCETLYYTGCRVSEALGLSPRHLDEDMNSVLIQSLKKRGNQHIRRIPIPESLTKRLLRIAPPEAGRFWSFSRTTAWRLVKREMAAAGLTGIHATCKGLRHAFGVRSALGKVPLPIIQAWMGHADSATTAIYLEVRDEEERELMGRTW
jgi:integrase/recombinase XerD